MKYYLLIFITLIVVACNDNISADKTSNNENSKHPYALDSIINTPIKFRPEEISTQIDKFNTSFSPDGSTVYYTATYQKLGLTGIAFQRFINGKYSNPEFVPFVSSDIPIADVQISPDGKLMLFSTFKDYKEKPEGFNFNIWTSEFINNTWQDPIPIGLPISSTGNEFYPVMTNNKSIYFNSDKNGNSDIYFSKFIDGAYQEPIRLPDNINSERREADAFVAKDESFMIFIRVDEPDGYGNSDLYISFRKNENEWSDPVNMGENVNSNQVDGSPYITPDGNYLIFTSGRINGGIKEEAMVNYNSFKSMINSSNNGSLNFYIMNFKIDDYK